MSRFSLALILVPLLVAGCRNQDHWNVGGGSTTPAYQRVEEDRTLLADTNMPVRVGEQGPAFPACNAQGTIRDPAADPVIIRAAPFAQARQTGQMPPATRFFICTRSMDQDWLGIVYQRGGGAVSGCGVSGPIGAARDYQGPCESGWISGAQVRLVSGDREAPVQASQNVAESK